MFSWWHRLATPPEVRVTVRLPEPLRTQVATLLGQDRRIDAVRRVRRETGLGLLPAVRAVDALAAGRAARDAVADEAGEEIAVRREYLVDGQAHTLLLGTAQPWDSEPPDDWAVLVRLVDRTGRETWRARVGGVDEVQAQLMAMLAAGNHLAQEQDRGREITFAGSPQLGLPVLVEASDDGARATVSLW